MSNEAIDYAKALAAELNHLDERWDAANRTVQTLDREITTVRDKMVEVVKGLGGVVVIGAEVYVAETDGTLVALEGVVAGQQQGQGHYDPATQSTMRWSSLGKATPPSGRIVLALPKGKSRGFPALYRPDEREWMDWHGNRISTSGSDLWAELPQPPRGE